MRIKFKLDGKDTLKTFFSIIKFFSKHGNKVFFVFSRDKLTLLLDKRTPSVWTEINMNQFAHGYEFIAINDHEEVVYLEFNTRSLLMGFKFFQNEADDAVVKLIKENNIPMLRINAHFDKGPDKTPKYRTEIPVIIVPSESFDESPIPENLHFTREIKSPRFLILQKYVEIYKSFKHIGFIFRKSSLQLNSFEIGFQVSTAFDGINYIKNESEDKETRLTAYVDVKNLAQYLTSVSLLHNVAIANLNIAIENKKNMKIFFKNVSNSLSFHYVAAAAAEIEDGLNDEDEEIEN